MKIKTNVRFASFIGSSKNLWTYQGFFLVAFKFYTFGSWFNYNHWVEVCYFMPLVYVSFIDVGLGFFLSKILILVLLGKDSNIVCWVSKSIEVRIIIPILYISEVTDKAQITKKDTLQSNISHYYHILITNNLWTIMVFLVL